MKVLFRPDELFRKLLPEQTPRSGFIYIPSQFSLPFSHRGRQFVFNTLTKQCVEAVLPERVTAGEGYDELIGARFLVPEDMDESAFYRSILTLLKLHDRKHLKPSYTILPTLGCNARCVYCFEEGMKPVGMTSETVEDTLHFIQKDCGGKEITLSWFGGEPLLREDVLDRICGGLTDVGIKYRCMMISNGSLITPNIIQKMKDLWHIQSIQISMDGAEQDYIARKRYVRYRDDYHTVIRAIDQLSEAGISVSVRCNADKNNLSGIPCFLNDLSAGISHKENVNIYFSPLYQELRGGHGTKLWTDILAMQDKIAEAEFDVTLERIGFVLSAYHCMADANGIVIAPNGTLHCCEELAKGSEIGNVRDGVTDSNARKKFACIETERGECRNCTFLPICMPFPTCPKYRLLCKEGYRVLTLDTLHKMIDKENMSSTVSQYKCSDDIHEKDL